MLAVFSRLGWKSRPSTFTIVDPPLQRYDGKLTCLLTVPLNPSLVLPMIIKVSEVAERITLRFSSSCNFVNVNGKQIYGESFTVTVQEPEGAFIASVHFPRGSYLYQEDGYGFTREKVTFFFSTKEVRNDEVKKLGV